jgi:hypothetical protein
MSLEETVAPSADGKDLQQHHTEKAQMKVA